MEAGVGRWLAETARFGDPDTRRAALVTVAGLVALIVPGYIAFSCLFAPASLFVYVTCSVAFLAALLGLCVALADNLRLAATLLAVAIWAVVAALTLHEGANSPHLGAFAPAIVGCALLSNARATLALTFASVLVLLCAFWLQMNGAYGVPPTHAPDLVAPTAQIIATGAFAAGLIHAFSRALMQLRLQDAALRQSEVRYTGLFEHCPDGILLLSETGELQAANDAALRLLGCSGHERALPPKFSSLPFDDASRALALDLSSGARSSGEVILHRDDKPHVLAINATRLDDADGPAGVQLALRDVTQAKEHEEAQRALDLRLRQSERMEAFGQLAGGVAHDFNNILTGILGHIDLIHMALDRGNVEKVSWGLSQLERSAERAAAITKQLLLFSRKSNLDAGVADVAATLTESRDLLRRLIREDVELDFQIHPTGTVAISSSAVVQIIMNLVINASDALSSGGTVSIRTGHLQLSEGLALRDRELGPGDYATIEVHDTGAGMPASLLSSVFEPFFTTKPPGQGTGLGLSTVHGIVQRARGHIEVCSELGEGSTFRIWLPLASSLELESSPTALAKALPAAQRRTVLVCEDEAVIRDVVSEVLTRHGFTVHATGSPREALELGLKLGTRLDLLITDVIMPEMNGPQLAGALSDKLDNIDVLYMSGYTAGLLNDLGIDDSHDRLLMKPFSPATLLERVTAVVSATRAPR